METKKNLWEMTEEEQQKYYNEKSNELIDVAITQILRNKIMYNKKLREKIQKEIEKLIKDTMNDLL